MSIVTPRLLLLGFLIQSLGVIQSPSLAGSGFTVKPAVEQTYLQNTIRVPRTQSAFKSKQITKTEKLAYQTEYLKSDELDYGTRRVVQEGRAGVIKRIYELNFWRGQKVSRHLVKKEVSPPVERKIKVGTRKVYKQLQTPTGELKYFRVIKMLTSSYDGSCHGCTGVTYLGTSVRRGVCAVDPEVISLGSELYIPGYGKCRAEDIGGAIKGKRIDLGFKDLSEGWWSKRKVKVYLLKEGFRS